IILHKDANIGFNGNVRIGLAYEDEAKFNSAIDLNYRNGKFNLYGSYGNNIGKYTNDGIIERFDDPTSTGFNENQLQLLNFFNNAKSHIYKVGVVYFINEKNTFYVFTIQHIYDRKYSVHTNIINIFTIVTYTQQIFTQITTTHYK